MNDGSKWDQEADDQLARHQNRLDMRGIARQNVKPLEQDKPSAGGADDLDRCIERDKSLRKITRIGGDAMIADTEHCVFAVDPSSAAHPVPGSRLLQTPQDGSRK